jgi:hypothetical protein
MFIKYASRFLKLVASCILGEKWNATMMDSQQECRKLFNSAKHDIRIVTGNLHHDLFENDQILSTLEDLITRDEAPVTIEIIHGPNPDPKSKRIFKLQQKAKGRVSIMRAPKRPGAHFVLVDGLRYRIEQYHEADKPERIAFIKTKSPIFLNRILAEKFDDLKLTTQKSGK